MHTPPWSIFQRFQGGVCIFVRGGVQMALKRSRVSKRLIRPLPLLKGGCFIGRSGIDWSKKIGAAEKYKRKEGSRVSITEE